MTNLGSTTAAAPTFLLGLALGLAGCGEGEDPLTIGSKDFTESLILGELIAQVAESEDIPVDRQIPYGGTFENIEALKRGDIDVYPEYNGTGLILLGQPPIHDGDESQERVQELYEPLGLTWQQRLGFANDYDLVMRQDRAQDLGVSTISDLTEIEGGVSFGIDKEFQERPVDGFSPMMRRYGLAGTADLITESGAEGKTELYQALLDGEVQVVEGFGTDGQIAEYGLTVLEDDLNFFPTYQPAPLVRAEAKERFQRLDAALQKLAGTIDIEAMRQMNAAVELEGMDPASVAKRFLSEQGIVDIPEEEIAAVEELRVAVSPLDSRDDQIAKALTAARRTFEGRNVIMVEVPDPMQALASGDVRLAVVDASSFFSLGDGVFPTADAPAQALGVVGYDVAHVITRTDDGVDSLGDAKMLGVGPAGGASEEVAGMMLTSLGIADQVELQSTTTIGEDDVLAEQTQALKDGELDALFLMTEAGHPEISALMEEGGARLIGIPEWQQGNNQVRFPFLRINRIPAGTYPGQDGPIDTVGSQVVLAGPARAANPVGSAGPGSAAIGEILPLADKSITALNEGLESAEQLDPALPSPDVLRPQAKPQAASINPSTPYSVVNLIVILVSIFLAYLYFREPPKRREPSLREPARPRPRGDAETLSGAPHV
jgi:glycine betaine/choline ABC-type transport system substrate-binding protein